MLARASAPFLLMPTLALAASLALAARGTPGAAGLAAVATVFLVAFTWFFRDPHREPGRGVVSPSDGTVQAAEEGHVRIFLSPFNVHVLRAPEAGTITRAVYRHGGHRPAFSKESDDNERLDLRLETNRGPIEVALIAGTVARRIRPYVTAGDKVTKGQRIGLIAFGSRCDVTLTPGTPVLVTPRQRVRANRTTIAT